MNSKTRIMPLLALMLLAAVPGVHAAVCSNATIAGRWAFTSDDLIESRFGVMQKVLWEANQCYERGCYNACSAMIRRLVENLIVECYERHGITDRIKKEGEYLEFGALIGKASNEPVLKLTRNTKRILPDLKFFGDIGAHNRMMLVKKADLDRLHQSIRSGIEELSRNL